MELSAFLNTRKSYPSLPDDYKESAEWEENRYFNAWIKKYPESKHEEIIERLKYIRSYILLFPDFDGEQWQPSQDAIYYYDNRKQRIENSGLSEDEFNEFEILQESIADLGLSPKATFDFIIFIWHELSKWLYRGTIERMEDRINRLVERIDERPNDSMELDIKIGRRHFKFTNQQFVKSIIASFISSNLESGNQVETIYPTKREIDYILVRTVLQFLPIKYIQVAYFIADDKTMEREFGNLLKIQDNYPKYVISMNPMLRPQNYEGIIHLTLRQFLRSDNL